MDDFQINKFGDAATVTADALDRFVTLLEKIWATVEPRIREELDAGLQDTPETPRRK